MWRIPLTLFGTGETKNVGWFKTMLDMIKSTDCLWVIDITDLFPVLSLHSDHKSSAIQNGRAFIILGIFEFKARWVVRFKSIPWAGGKLAQESLKSWRRMRRNITITCRYHRSTVNGIYLLIKAQNVIAIVILCIKYPPKKQLLFWGVLDLPSTQVGIQPGSRCVVLQTFLCCQSAFPLIIECQIIGISAGML